MDKNYGIDLKQLAAMLNVTLYLLLYQFRNKHLKWQLICLRNEILYCIIAIGMTKYFSQKKQKLFVTGQFLNKSNSTLFIEYHYRRPKLQFYLPQTLWANEASSWVKWACQQHSESKLACSIRWTKALNSIFAYFFIVFLYFYMEKKVQFSFFTPTFLFCKTLTET